jgi:DNA-binding NarL/FixJ family response regulator
MAGFRHIFVGFHGRTIRENGLYLTIASNSGGNTFPLRMRRESEMIDRPIHVLLVEDNPGDTRLIRDLFAEEPSIHISWTHARLLATAIDKLRTEPFDIVLLDLALSDSYGLNTFTHLHPHAICLPVIVLTDLNDEKLAIQTIRAGAQDYLIKKDIDIGILERSLFFAIERKRSETTLRMWLQELKEIALAQLTVAEHLNSEERVVAIAHELNASLTTLSLRTASTLAQSSLADSRLKPLRTILEESDRMRRLVVALLAIIQGDLPQTSIQDVNVDPARKLDLVQFLRSSKLITSDEDEANFFQTLGVWAADYVIRSMPVDELNSVIELMARQGVPVPRMFGAQLLNNHLERIRKNETRAYERLSAREHGVLHLIAEGHTNREIAEKLSVSVRTIERHRSSIMNKLGLQNRAELVAYAVRQALMSKDDIE